MVEVLPAPFTVPKPLPDDPEVLRDELVKRGVSSIFVVVCDVRGNPRGPWVSIEQLPEICTAGQSTDGSSIPPYGVITNSDARIIVDPRSVRRLPGHASIAIGFGNAVYARSHEPNPGCFRTTLQQLLTRAQNKFQIKFLAGFETEFFLDDRDQNLERPYVPGIGIKDNYQRLPYQTPNFELLETLVRHLANDGLQVTVVHTEVSHRQFEINTAAADPVRAAEDCLIMLMALQEVADKLDGKVNLAAKPVQGWNGTGEHTHLSAQWLKDGENALFNPDGSFTEFGGSFVSGIVGEMTALTFLGNLSGTSYRRLKSVGFESPTRAKTVDWANRTCGLRITGGSPSSFHLEYRVPAPEALNPFALMIGMIAAGLYGAEEKLSAPMLLGGKNAYDFQSDDYPLLPDTFEKAQAAFAQSEVMRQAFSEQQFQTFCSLLADPTSR